MYETLKILHIISFVSCSDDSESITLSEEEKMLVGAWQIQSFNYTGTSTGMFGGMEMTSTYKGVAQNLDAVLSFNDNRTFNFQGSYDVKLTVETMDLMVPVQDASSSGDWYIQDNYLYTSDALGQVNNEMVQGPQDGRMRIQENTENRLVLKIDQESEVNQNGMEFLVKLSGEYILTK